LNIGLIASVIKRLFELNISITCWNINLFGNPDLNLNPRRRSKMGIVMRFTDNRN